MKEGTGSINIDGFIFTDASVEDAGRIIDTCINQPTPTPIDKTPTPVIKTPTPVLETPTPTPTQTEQWTPDPDDCFCAPTDFDTYLIDSYDKETVAGRFQNFPLGAEISFKGEDFISEGVTHSVINPRYNNDTPVGLITFSGKKPKKGSRFYIRIGNLCYYLSIGDIESSGRYIGEVTYDRELSEKCNPVEFTPTPTPTPIQTPTPTPTPTPTQPLHLHLLQHQPLQLLKLKHQLQLKHLLQLQHLKIHVS